MKILMVCLGNICRSPLAQGILEYKVKEKGLNWEVDSAGTSGWHSGESPDIRSVDVARRNGIDLSNQRSRKFTHKDLDAFDVIFAMDSQNFQDILSLAEDHQDQSKVELILNYLYPGENRAVPDPYYEGGFDKVFIMLENAIDNFIESKL